MKPIYTPPSLQKISINELPNISKNPVIFIEKVEGFLYSKLGAKGGPLLSSLVALEATDPRWVLCPSAKDQFLVSGYFQLNNGQTELLKATHCIRLGGPMEIVNMTDCSYKNSMNVEHAIAFAPAMHSETGKHKFLNSIYSIKPLPVPSVWGNKRILHYCYHISGEHINLFVENKKTEARMEYEIEVLTNHQYVL